MSSFFKIIMTYIRHGQLQSSRAILDYQTVYVNFTVQALKCTPKDAQTSRSKMENSNFANGASGNQGKKWAFNII